MEEFASKLTESADSQVIELSGSVTIHYAAEVKEALLAAFQQTGSISCSVSGVSDLDLSGLQLLCSAHKFACNSGRSFAVAGLDGEIVRKSIEAAGFSRHVGCLQDLNKTCLWVGGAE